MNRQVHISFDPPPASLPAWTQGKLDGDLMRRFAQRYVNLLGSVCSRIEIAGSIRRRKMVCQDVELVCIEKEPGAVYRALCRYQSQKQLTDFWVKHGEKYLQFRDLCEANIPPFTGGQKGSSVSASSLIPHPSSLLPVPVDVFLTQPDYWGWTYFIRTGSSDWNKACILRLRDRGYKIDNNNLYKISGSSLIHDSSSLREEQDIFALLGIPFVEPHLRTDADALKHIIFSNQIRR